MKQEPLSEKINQNSLQVDSPVCKFQLCKQECSCATLQSDFVAQNSQVIYEAIIANNPHNPGFSLKQGCITYSAIETIPIVDICKVKLCFKNQFMLMHTLQVYPSHNPNNPVCLGVNQADGSIWFLRVMEAKLVSTRKLRIIDDRKLQPTVNGTLFKKTTLGKWKRHQATCSTVPPFSLKFRDEYFGVGSTSQVWSRFEVMEEEGVVCLILKLWGTLGKIEVGIPVSQLVMWVRSICSLLG